MTDALVCPACDARARAARALLRGLRPAARARAGLDRTRHAPSSRERARKVRPGYAEGPLVRVAAARHQAEAEMIQGLLLEEGIPSLARRSGGFDVPDFLASGPRDILVVVGCRDAAREILGDPRAPRRLARRAAPAVGARAGGDAGAWSCSPRSRRRSRCPSSTDMESRLSTWAAWVWRVGARCGGCVVGWVGGGPAVLCATRGQTDMRGSGGRRTRFVVGSRCLEIERGRPRWGGLLIVTSRIPRALPGRHRPSRRDVCGGSWVIRCGRSPSRSRRVRGRRRRR